MSVGGGHSHADENRTMKTNVEKTNQKCKTHAKFREDSGKTRKKKCKNDNPLRLNTDVERNKQTRKKKYKQKKIMKEK